MFILANICYELYSNTILKQCIIYKYNEEWYLIFYGHRINLWVIVEVGKIRFKILPVTQMKIPIKFLNCILLLFIYL